MLYFIPEWDDLVYQKYNYWNDKPVKNSPKVYAHEIYNTPNYDGILVSRSKAAENKSKITSMSKLGVHKYLRFTQGPIFGDCGAFSYVKEKKPPFSTNDVAEFYHNLGFDYGVSVDHLCIPAFKSDWQYRFDLTNKNAEKFYTRWEAKGYTYHAVGAAQGWDVESYKESVDNLIDIGYTHIALGGMARSPTSKILKILEGLQASFKRRNLWIHLFGVARLDAIRKFTKLGVNSVDSASALRNAWLGAGKNYRDADYKGYTALRLPFTTRVSSSAHYKDLVRSGFVTDEELKAWEYSIYALLREYEFGNNSVQLQEIVDAFEDFNNLYGKLGSPSYNSEYSRTLIDRPWENCDCTICKNNGMEVIIFRGNNRNRRRGFHNTYVFFNLFKKILEDPKFKYVKPKSEPHIERQFEKGIELENEEILVDSDLDEFFD
jgi:queuine/archaeosine tRNA-ribosyltransferase